MIGSPSNTFWAHRSGIGDYLDESGDYQVDDYVMTVPVHQLADSDDYVKVLDGYPQQFTPGERFAYNNAGFVLLAILVERAAGTAFVDLVQHRVCTPANMVDTAYLRSDSLPERTALGYLDVEGHRSNVLHLPVRGSGDGGAYTTVADIHSMWQALLDGTILDRATLAAAWRPRSDVPAEGCAAASASFCTPPGRESCSRDPTPASPSAPCMIPTPTQPIRSSPTGRTEPGRLPEHSTRSSSAGDGEGQSLTSSVSAGLREPEIGSAWRREVRDRPIRSGSGAVTLSLESSRIEARRRRRPLRYRPSGPAFLAAAGGAPARNCKRLLGSGSAIT